MCIIDQNAKDIWIGWRAVTASGEYECSECGHRQHFTSGEQFPPDHDPQKPWALYVKD